MKKKILFIIWTFTGGGGAERILANIVNNLSDEKYDIDILEYKCLGIRNEDIRDNINLIDPILNLNNKVFNSRAEEIKRKFMLLRESIIEKLVWIYPKGVRNLRVKEKYDIEVAFNYLIPSFLISFKGKSFCWIHTSIEDLDDNNLSGIKKLSTKYRRFLLGRKLSKVDNIVAISNRTEESISLLYPEFKNKIVKIYNGYNIKEILNKANEEIKYRKIKPTIISIGRLQKQKNFLCLIEVARVLDEKNKDFQLLILGEGEQREEIENKIKQYNLEEKVKMLGYIKNPYPYIKLADVYCMTSLAEGFPTVLVEAMSLGCPFVSTNVAGADELSSNGKNGIITTYDKEDIANSLIKVLENEVLRRDMASSGKIKANEYSIERQISLIEELFNN